jgi:hypothetical protein
MSGTQPALRIDPHGHLFSETCPTCDQPIPNEKANEIRARAATAEKRLATEAEARAAQKLAADKAEIEAAAKARIEQAEREKTDTVKKAYAEATAKVEGAKAEGRKLAEAGFTTRLEAAEKARADAEKAKADAEQAAKDRQEESQKQLEAANAKVREVEAQRDSAMEARAREVREAMERDKADALAAFRATKDAETQKLIAELDALKRQQEKQRAAELREGAHIKLLDALKAEFPSDDIRRIQPGVSGADILHTVMRNGIESGSILWESKNSTGWRDEYVTKLIRDQTAARADHAVLSTLKFPRDTAQVAIRDGVVIVNPMRAVVIAHIIRSHLLLIHTLRLSKAQRMEKMAALYDFMTSERCALLLNRIDSDAEALLDLQVSEKKFHDKHWERQALRYKSIQKAKADLDVEIGAIIGGVESVG